MNACESTLDGYASMELNHPLPKDSRVSAFLLAPDSCSPLCAKVTVPAAA